MELTINEQETMKEKFYKISYNKIQNAILNINKDEVPDIYALSFFMTEDSMEAYAQSIIVGYNTISQFEKEKNSAYTEDEAKWNYAYWLQNQIVKIGGENDKYLRNWFENSEHYYEGFFDINNTEEIPDNDEYDWDKEEKYANFAIEFEELSVRISQQLHTEGIIIKVFGKSIPIIIHDLTRWVYYQAIIEEANPVGVAYDFIKWTQAFSSSECESPQQNNKSEESFKGKTLAGGKYKIIEHLGESGFSVTLKALQYIGDTNLGTVLIKSSISKYDSDSIIEFINEAIALRKINHPNLVNLYDVFIEDGIPYLVMEYIEGWTLSDLIIDDYENDLSPERIFHIMAQLGDAVSNLHDKGVLHCDLNPHNIIVKPWLDIDYRPDFVKIVNFGLASLWRNNAWQSSCKKVILSGFAAPEQLYETPSPLSDLYSLGVILYVLITGNMPYNTDLCLNHKEWLAASPPAMPDCLPAEVASFVQSCIEPRQEKRYGGLPGFVRQCIDFRQMAAKYEKSTAQQDVKTLLKLAKETFLSAGLSRNQAEKEKLYARSAELFEELKQMKALPKSMEKFAEKSKKYGKITRNTNEFKNFIETRNSLNFKDFKNSRRT